MFLIFRIISEFGVYCGYKTPQLSNWTYSRPNLTGFPSYNSILYYVYTDKSQEAGDLRPTNLQNEITDLMNPKTKLGSKLASFMNSSTTFQGISGITIIGTIPTDPPRISGTISIGSGNTWISLQNISLDDNGYLIAGARRGYLPSFYEVLLDYNKNISTYNASSSNNTIQNYAGKVSSTIKGSFNFTNLTENSTYYLAIYSKNLDDTFLTNPSDPLIIILQTNEQPIITVLSSAALHVSLFVILMSFFFIML